MSSSGHPVDHEVVVYGGTSGGVVAAVQASALGKSVILVTPTERLGGLTTSGLGWTDLGNQAILGGWSRRFYHEVYLHYQDPAAWDKQTKASFGNSGQGGPAFNDTQQIASVFEPKVAESIFNRWIAETGVPVVVARIDLAAGAVMENGRVTALRAEDGRLFRGRMFIDASYEGDLMAAAGVTFTVGRESNSVYGETINGTQTALATKHQLPNGVSPYRVPGNPASGLLPGIDPEPVAADGTGDARLQAFCFRMVLTDLPSNRVTIQQPAGYNEEEYEILFRAIEAGAGAPFFKLDRMPNRKTDSNNNGGVSTDYIGRNYGPGWDWTTLDHDERQALADEHREWQLGLVWSLQNHPRVPLSIRNTYASWGLPADEFTENGNWPSQIYVREGRRMVSDYVMMEQNCRRTRTAPDSVGLAAYTMDSHHVRRRVAGGMVKNEGDVQVGVPGPYPVSYRSIIPARGECKNLLVPWSLSASHMAFGSIRMEPVFMALSHSAATAACLALDSGLAVQDLAYEQLAPALRADGQALTVTPPAAADGIVVDNSGPGVQITGEWLSSVSVTGFIGADYLHDNNTGQGTKSVRFTPNLPAAGDYEVFLRWTQHANRAANAPVTVTHATGVHQTTVDQRSNGGVWFRLGTFPFEAGFSGHLRLANTGANGFVIADAAMWSPVGGATPPVTVTALTPRVIRGGKPQARFVIGRPGPGAEALAVSLALAGTAAADEWSGTYNNQVTIPAGASEAVLSLTANSLAVPRGETTLVFSVVAAPGYTAGNPSAAIIVLADCPFDLWRHQRFDAAALADPAVSGATAAPGGDDRPNLVAFFCGDGVRGSGSDGGIVRRDGSLWFRFHRSHAANATPWRLESSRDLLTWHAWPPFVGAIPRQPSAHGGEWLELPLDQAPPGAVDDTWFRLRLTLPATGG